MLPDLLAGKKTYIAAIIAAVLAANQEMKFIPEQYIQMLIYIATALGLWGVRSALGRMGADASLPPPSQPFVQRVACWLMLGLCLAAVGCKAAQTTPATKPCCPDGKCPPSALKLACGCDKCNCCGACAR